MPRVPIVFGGGLDREIGVMAMTPGGMEDLRNVHIMQGKFQVRRGFERVLEFVDGSGNDQTDILAGIAMLGRRAAIYVTYDSVNRLVNVFYGDGSGSWATYLGEWPFVREDSSDIITASNDDPPVVILAEYNNVVFMAHAQNSVVDRAQTYYVEWNSVTGVYDLTALTVEDWGGPVADPGGEQKVRFRGVRKHKEYMIGWGWGDTDNIRPEFVRVSEPGEPTSFLENHYWITGDEGDPVITCLPVGNTLLAFKESETWELFGSSFANFGQDRIDQRFGMLQPRLAEQVNDMIFAWTNEGPRLYTPYGPSRGAEIPLELTLPEPYDLVTQGDEEYAFAVYMPVYRSIWFVFGRRVYSLYIREENNWRWGYQELGFTPMCGFELPQSGWGLVTQPEGYPTISGTVASQTSVEITVTNNSQDGDETLEIWMLQGGDTDWALVKSAEVTSAASQTITVEDLDPGWYYDVAVRYRRGPYYSVGYESSNPEDWDVLSQAFFTTTMSSLPTINSATWSRTGASAEQIQLVIAPPFSGTGYDLEIRRDSVLIYTEEDVSGTVTYADTGVSGETNEVYDCRLVTPYVNGSYTSTTTRWAGPPAPTITLLTTAAVYGYAIDWANGGSYETEVWDDTPVPTGDFPDTLETTEAAGVATWQTIGDATWSGETVEVGIRHKLTSYTVDDYSEYDTDTVAIP